MNVADGASLVVDKDGVLRLNGRIGYPNAEQIYPLGSASLAKGGLSRIDLSALENADSATLAMLLAWVAEAGKSGRTLAITGAPDDLRALARLGNVESLLRLS